MGVAGDKMDGLPINCDFVISGIAKECIENVAIARPKPRNKLNNIVYLSSTKCTNYRLKIKI